MLPDQFPRTHMNLLLRPSGFTIMLASLRVFWSLSLSLILMYREPVGGPGDLEKMFKCEQEIKC